MRQAGRYHSHYRGLREKYSFMDLCKVPELAAEVAMGPIREFDFDVSILFSDLLFPLEAMGMGLSYEPAPTLGWHLDTNTLQQLRKPDDAMGALEFQAKAVQATRALLPKEKSLIGFVGGPWTLYVYAVEGGHQGSLAKAKAQPKLFIDFCEYLIPLLEKNIKLQLDAGAELVMLFDTAAGELSPTDFHTYVLPGLKRIANRFPKQLGYYSKGTNLKHLDPIYKESLPFLGLGFDHRWDISDALRSTPYGFVQGNFDQSLLFLDSVDFEDAMKRYFEPILKLSDQQRSPWVAGLGHGVLPQTPEKNVHILIETTRKLFS